MATKDVILKVKTDTSQAEKGFQRVDASIGKIATSLGLVFSTQQLIQVGYESIKLAASVEGVATAFNKLGDPYLLEGLRKATKDTISDFDLMKISMRASNFKVPMDVLAKGLEFAQKRAAQTGQEVDYLANSFIDGLGRKSTLVLDNLGISATELQAEIKKVGDFSIAVGNIVDRELGKMGDVALTTADEFAQINAELENMKVKFGDIEIKALRTSKTILDWWYNGPGFLYKELINLISGSEEKVLKMISPHLYNKNKGGGSVEEESPIVPAIKKEMEIIGLANNLYGDYVEVLRQAYKEREKFGLKPPAELTTKNMPYKPTIPIPDESELRSAFREFDVIANESARTLYGAFSQAWEDIFGKANNLFEQLLQNIGMGLLDLVAQDISSSIFSALIPGGGLLDGLFGKVSGGGGTVLVQIGESQVQQATANTVQSTYAEFARRKIL
jgi:hypothetical protein